MGYGAGRPNRVSAGVVRANGAGVEGAQGADAVGADRAPAGWTGVAGRGVGGALVRERGAARYETAGRADSVPQRHADPRTLSDLDTPSEFDAPTDLETPSSPDTPRAPDGPSHLEHLAELDTLPDLARFRALDPAPDPFEIPDELESLQAAVVTLAAHVHAANHRMLTYIAEFDRLGGWKLAGHRNCAEWLHFHTGIQKGAAREWVRAARALPRLPLVSEAMSRGELSFSKVRAVTRLVEDLAPEEGEEGATDGVTDETKATADADTDADQVADQESEAEAAAGTQTPSAAEAEVLSYARACTTAELERFVRSWRHVCRGDEAELERRRHRSRSLTVSPDGGGMYRIRGTLDPEVGALLMRAIDWASDQLFHTGDDWAPEGGPRGPRTEEVTPRQRRADAIGLLAELAMGGGAAGAEDADTSGDGCGCGDRNRDNSRGSASQVAEGDAGEVQDEANATAEDPETRGDAVAHASTGGCGCSDQPPATHTARERASSSRLSSSRPERYTVMLHVDAATLADAGRSHLDDGTRVSGETSRRLSCDASVVRVTHAADGSILDLGRKTRTLSPALRRALEIRDGGCRFPGCGLRFIEGHHIVHWEDGGETRLSNLVSLCRRHHRAVHEEGFSVQVLSDGRLRFLDLLGWPLPDCPPPSRLAPRPVERLMADHKRRGIDPDEDAPAARYRRRADVPWDLEARAWEAVDG